VSSGLTLRTHSVFELSLATPVNFLTFMRTYVATITKRLPASKALALN
jgi:hypothetical protein